MLREKVVKDDGHDDYFSVFFGSIRYVNGKGFCHDIGCLGAKISSLTGLFFPDEKRRYVFTRLLFVFYNVFVF